MDGINKSLQNMNKYRQIRDYNERLKASQNPSGGYSSPQAVEKATGQTADKTKSYYYNSKTGKYEQQDFAPDTSPTYKTTKGENDLYVNREVEHPDGRYEYNQILTPKGEAVETRAEERLPKLFEKDEKGKYKIDRPAINAVRNRALNVLSNDNSTNFLDLISAEKNNPYKAAKGDANYNFDLTAGNVKSIIPILNNIQYDKSTGELTFVPNEKQETRSLRAFSSLYNVAQTNTAEKGFIKNIVNKNRAEIQKGPNSRQLNILAEEGGDAYQKYVLKSTEDGFKFVINDQIPALVKYIKEDTKTSGELRALNSAVKAHQDVILENNPALFERVRKDASATKNNEVLKSLGQAYRQAN
tara:strand:+ start:34049 stop:35119 length:1071 start_codon:yes stop_codon:yes gene_type:complete